MILTEIIKLGNSDKNKMRLASWSCDVKVCSPLLVNPEVIAAARGEGCKIEGENK